MAAPTKSTSPAKDLFAEIAARRGDLTAGLERPRTPAVPRRLLRDDTRVAPFRPLPRINDPAGVQRELARLRRVHARFLDDRAPALPATRRIQPITTFQWRIATETDLGALPPVLAGEGAWETVTIPHYGAPLGKATTYYRATIQADAELLARGAVALCFDGVDYTAQVFLNGTFLGSHEGFFAPFRFDATRAIRTGSNTLLVVVGNDGICNGGGDKPTAMPGDKLYAATGPGYDEPVEGWHHCPPGMGIFQRVWLEGRSSVVVHDMFVRPLPDLCSAEAWIEIDSWHEPGWREGWSARLSVHGQNLPGTPLAHLEVPLPKLGPGVNQIRVPLTLPGAKPWTPDHPWLYRLGVEIRDAQGRLVDVAGRSFGLRTFVIDEQSSPKGRLLLNGQEIRLRGANTMGYEQLRVMRGERDGLIDDLLLGKVARMNFLRITQRPVQREIYDLCDRLGILVQTDLPLFGHLRRTQFCEAIRQCEEMERLIRGHASCILVSYINEPFPDSWRRQTHRQLTRPELESFFRAADEAVRLANPDRAIKPIDGDYDQPGPGLPDMHCYSLWYNGHGAPIGELHAGEWLGTKPGWNFGCGEFGAEGLEDPELMHRAYPKAWLPSDAADERVWGPNRIPYAQSWNMHFMFYDRPQSLAEWHQRSQAWQARATTLMTEALRRHPRCVSFAIHLFIDAWPTGWMKTIMDVDRRPKQAFYAWRDALAPVHVHARSDRLAWNAGETVEVEAWLCNDTQLDLADHTYRWQAELDGRIIATGTAPVLPVVCSTRPQGRIRVRLPAKASRGTLIIRTRLESSSGTGMVDHALELAVWPLQRPAVRPVIALGAQALTLCKELGLTPLRRSPRAGDAILIGDLANWQAHEADILCAVADGATAQFLPLPVGIHAVAGDRVEVANTALGQYDFVSRATGHPLVEGFGPDDFRLWHDAVAGRIVPLISQVIEPIAGWQAILATGSGQFWGGPGLHAGFAAAEKVVGRGAIRLCQVHLLQRTSTNPAARAFALRLLGH